MASLPRKSDYHQRAAHVIGLGLASQQSQEVIVEFTINGLLKNIKPILIEFSNLTGGYEGIWDNPEKQRELYALRAKRRSMKE